MSQGQLEHQGGAAGRERPLELREVPRLLLTVLALGAALGAAALVIHLVLRINWLASVAAAPLLLMAVTLIVNAVRKRRAKLGAGAPHPTSVGMAWADLSPVVQPVATRRLYRGRTGIGR